MSPVPAAVAAGSPGVREGWLIYGKIMRPMRFQSFVRWKGTTG